MASAASPTEADRAYELAYTEGVRALSEQQAVVDSFRTRAGLLFSAAAIATSFLGGAALRDGASPWTSIAIGLFVFVGAAVGVVLWPRDDWQYPVRPRLLIENYIEDEAPLPIALVHRDLALHMDRSYLRNRGQLLALAQSFRAASVLLLLEVLAWVADLLTQV